MQLHKASTGSSSRRRFTAIRSGGSAIRTTAVEGCTEAVGYFTVLHALADSMQRWKLISAPHNTWRGCRGKLIE